MLSKSAFFILLVLLQASLSTVWSQESLTEKGVARVLYKLENFRNPSQLRSRFGLLRFSSDGAYLATVGTTRDVVIYDLQSDKTRSTLDNGNLGFTTFSFSPDSREVIVQDASYNKVRVFETASGKLIREISSTGRIDSARKMFLDMQKDVGGLEMGSAPVSPDWKTVFLNSREGEYQMIDLATGDVKHALEHSAKSGKFANFFKAMAFPLLPLPFWASNVLISSDGKRMMISNGNKNPSLWNAETGQLIVKLTGHDSIVMAVAFSPDGQLAATSDFKGITKVWKTDTGELLTSFGSKKQKAFIAAWSPDSERLVTREYRKDANVWDAKGGKLLFSLEKSGSSYVIYSPDGKFAATSGQDDKDVMARIWDAENGKLLSSLPRQKSEDRAFSIIWSPDNELVVTSSSQSVKLWTSTGKLLQSLENAVFPARFSPDGKLLATGGKDDIGFVWQIDAN